MTCVSPGTGSYEAYIDGEWRAIVRYDEAHGYYHKDVMTPFFGQTKFAQSAANLDLASEVLLGMILGYVEPASLMMVFERAPGQNAVIDLSDETSRQRAEAFIDLFRRDSQRGAVDRISELLLTEL